jgi:hypothetical protein
MRTQYVLLAFFLAATTYGQEALPDSLESKFDKTVIDYVNNTLLKEQDANGDGYLDKDEWVKGNNWSKSNPPENSDLNGDGKLSREELCIRISASRGLPIKGEPFYPADMLAILRAGLHVKLMKESGRFDVTILTAKDVEANKENDKDYRPITVKRVSKNYVVLTFPVVPGRDFELFISANVISSISVPIETQEPKNVKKGSP